MATTIYCHGNKYFFPNRTFNCQPVIPWLYRLITNFSWYKIYVNVSIAFYMLIHIATIGTFLLITHHLYFIVLLSGGVRCQRKWQILNSNQGTYCANSSQTNQRACKVWIAVCKISAQQPLAFHHCISPVQSLSYHHPPPS